MSFEIFLAKRYLRGNRSTFGGTLTSVIAMSGIAVGVAALIITLSVMTGFREDIRRKILGVQPHLLVSATDNVLPRRDWEAFFRDLPDAQAWAPFVMGQALLRKGSQSQGVVVKGVDPDREAAVTGLHERLYDGRWDSLKTSAGDGAPASGPPILLGRELARALRADIGDTVLAAAPAAEAGALLSLPPVFPFTVTGLLETGLFDYDSTLAVVPMRAAQRLFQLDAGFSGLGVRLRDADESVDAARDVQKRVGAAALVRSWLALNQNLFAALKLEKVVMFIILTLITLVAAFTIVSNLLLVTAQKVREIGILRAMGARRRSIEKIFLLKGVLMGGAGTVAGTLIGLAGAALLKRYPVVKLPADVYYVETLPVQIVPSDVGLVAGAAMAIVLLASLYPARLAAKLDALTAIRQG